MLQNGAKKVYAIDVGHDQLEESLRKNEKVVNMEGTNVKELKEKGLIIFENGENLKEKNLALTERGKICAEEITGELKDIEKIAMEKTLEKYSIKFIEAFEYLLESMENEIKIRLENKKGNDKKV